MFVLEGGFKLMVVRSWPVYMKHIGGKICVDMENMKKMKEEWGTLVCIAR